MFNVWFVVKFDGNGLFLYMNCIFLTIILVYYISCIYKYKGTQSWYTHTHTHTHTYIYIYIYRYIVWFYCSVFRYLSWKFKDSFFLPKTANDCFFYFSENCAYAKITALVCFENWFRTCPKITCGSSSFAAITFQRFGNIIG